MASPAQAFIDNRSNIQKGSRKLIQIPLEEAPHFFLLSLVEYTTNDPEENKQAVDNVIQHISLPIPAQIIDKIGLNYQGTEFGPKGRAISEIGEAGANFFRNFNSPTLSMNDLTGRFDGVDVTGGLRYLGRSAIQKLDAGIAGAVDRVIGNVLNPHLTTTFQGPQLRTFNFSWKMYAQSPEESIAIQQALGIIRQTILPSKELATFAVNVASGAVDTAATKKGLFTLKYPGEAFASVITNGEKRILQIGRSVITDLQINYAPGGVPVFFKGTHEPAEIEFSFSMQEVTPLIRDDLSAMEDFPNRKEIYGEPKNTEARRNSVPASL